MSMVDVCICGKKTVINDEKLGAPFTYRVLSCSVQKRVVNLELVSVYLCLLSSQ